MALDQRLKVAFKTVNSKRRGYLTFDGAPAWLAGRLPSSGSPIVAPDRGAERTLIKQKIRELARVNNNLFKWWMLFYPAFHDHQNDNQTFFSPFARVGGKWDLATPNERYYEALDLTLREAMRHGIVVEIGLFDGPGLKGQGVPDAALRWPSNPWNSKNNRQGAIVAGDTVGAVKTFFTDPGIRLFQRQYVEEVVRRTKGYWNVVYELMNEPAGDLVNAGPVADDPEIVWADQAIGWIHAQTAGRRLIFYNTFPNAQDIAQWRRTDAAGRPVYPNYRNFHGVIFHGDPQNVTPDPHAFAAEKAIQASSDGAGGDDTPDWFRTRTEHCFRNDLSFQAHAVSLDAGHEIDNAVVTVGGQARRTVPLVPWQLLGRFHRRVPDQAWDVRFYIDGTWINFVPSPYQLIERGRFTLLDRGRFRNFRPNGVVADWAFTLNESGPVPRLVLTRESDGFRQELDQVVYPGSADDDVPYGPFLFNWAREFATNSSPHYALRFDVDRSFLSYLPGPPASELLRGDVANLGSDPQGTFIDFVSERGSERWRYRFLQGGSKLELSNPTLTQRFVRRDAVRPVF